MTYSPQQLGIAAPSGGFQDLGWYGGRQYVGGSLGEVNQIHPNSPQQGAGQQVSSTVRAQSAAQQGVTPQQFDDYLNQQANSSITVNYDPNSGDGGVGGGNGGGGGGGGTGLGIAPAATIDLPSLYKSLYDSEGVSNLEKQITDKTNGYDKAVSTINDNPYLSEGDRTGRAEKLRIDFNNDIQNDHDALDMKRADIDTQMNLQTKQFDINSQAASQAMSQFNTLLSSGALDNANGSDIANLTRATGMSSSMIQSAISASKAKNVQTQVIPFDDGTNQGFAVIDPKTGRIINKQVVAGSKPTAAEIKAGQGLSDSQQITLDRKQAPQSATQDANSKMTLGTMMNLYQQYGMSKQQIYNIYSAANAYHPTAAQIKADKKKYGVK